MLWRVTTGLLAIALAATITACGGDEATVSRERFASGVQGRYDLTAGEADCLTDFVYEDYDVGAIRVIHEDGLTGLPQALWDPFLHSVIGCTIPDGSLGS